jgi:uncharacterized membrane protein YdbT with pleckstrin-like domain
VLAMAWNAQARWLPVAVAFMLLHVAWIVYSRRKNARYCGYVLLPDFLLIRWGYFSQSIQLIRRDAIHMVSIMQSEFDRSYRMATLEVELSTGLPELPRPNIHYLAINDALRLARDLRLGLQELEPIAHDREANYSAAARSLAVNASAGSAGA